MVAVLGNVKAMDGSACVDAASGNCSRPTRSRGAAILLPASRIGFFNYHAVPTNWDALGAFRTEITERWRRTLSRRSQKGGLTWARMAKLADDWLPKPRILHPWPNQRFAVRHPR